MDFVVALNSIFWGWLIAGILLLCGLFYTIILKAPQVRYFFSLIPNLWKASRDNSGVSAFGALCAAVGSEVGAGSLVGVSTALVSGGPGAIFWMWVTAILGMPIMFGEAVLGQLFRVSNGDGTYRGGPVYYMSKGMNNKVLPTLFAISLILGNGGIWCMIQSNSIASAFSNTAFLPSWCIGIVLVILVGLVIFGGIKRLSSVASYIVPFMAVTYIALSLVVMMLNYEKIPYMFSVIVESAFGAQQVAGGLFGYSMQEAFRYGVARGLFSNDAGAGTTPSMHAAANVKHPVNQGLSGMLGVFMTTMVVCSSTAFCILLSVDLNSGAVGITLTQQAFSGTFGSWGDWIVAGAMLLFGYTTLLSNIYYGEINIGWLCSNRQNIIQSYRVFACILVFLGAIVSVVSLWEVADLCGAFMVLFNVIALFVLAKYVKFALVDYKKQMVKGMVPLWDYDEDIVDLYKKKKGVEKHA